ncbi:kinase-like protein [Heliocybe sulcata]|uniref:Kinase-like protein n=1 Tax=Heliocybe sulcata TaxID=5364 RepID=A0A5C3N026_9AGAM|nr:kinase-like protein [Heliocybe sulcata]
MAALTDLTGKLTQLSTYQFAVGLHCDLWKAALGDSGQLVVVKAVRTSWNSPEDLCKVQRRILREIKVLSALDHPNIIPFLGVTYGFGRAEIPSPVCPLYESGDIVQYLKRESLPTRDRFKLISQVAAGLSYLHRRGVVHGDIKGANILIGENGALLCDFGLSRILGAEGFTTQAIGGTCRWMAPELLLNDDDETLPRLTIFSDVWAFAMTVLEIMTGRRPFSDKLADVAVLLAVINGGRPYHRDYREIDDGTWTILSLCWQQKPRERLSMNMLGLFFDLAAYMKSPDQAKKMWDEASRILELSPKEQGNSGSPYGGVSYPCQWPHCQDSLPHLEYRQKHEVEHASLVPHSTTRWPEPRKVVRDGHTPGA